MNDEKLILKAMIFGKVLSVIEVLCAVIGLFSFFGMHNNLYLTCGIVLIVLGVINMFIGNQSPTTMIVAAVIGAICLHQIWPGICIGLCFEGLIMQLAGIVMMFVMGRGKK